MFTRTLTQCVSLKERIRVCQSDRLTLFSVRKNHSVQQTVIKTRFTLKTTKTKMSAADWTQL